jgi:predicted MFS family arabinose efflux permease
MHIHELFKQNLFNLLRKLKIWRKHKLKGRYGMSDSRPGKLLIPSLAMSRTAPQIRGLLANFLLIEIADTYNLSLGVTNQIKTINNLVGIIVALLMGFLSVKFRHKVLLITGLMITTLSLVGCYFAPTFLTLAFFYGLGGFGASMTMPMSTALTGQFVPRSERSKSMRWLFALPAFLYVVGYQIANYLGHWRNGFLYFALPATLFTMLMCFIGIPKKETKSSDQDILSGYKGIFRSKSAVSSLIGTALGSGVWVIFLTLSASWYRQVYGVSRGDLAIIVALQALLYIAGALLSSRIILKVGLRNATIVSTLLLGLFSMIFFVKFPFTLLVITGGVYCFIGGLRISSAQGLCLIQLPELRGSMMSMVSVVGSLGGVITLSLGGYLLIAYGWQVMFPVIGVFGLLGGLIVYLYTQEPST